MRLRWVSTLVVGTTVLAGCGMPAAPQPNPHPPATRKAHSATPHSGYMHHRRMHWRGRGLGAWDGSWLTKTSAVKPVNLSTLPPLSYVQALNPWTRRALQVSGFINGMGYHWATSYPSLVLMTNQAGLVTGVEATFPQKLGSFSWYDPPTTVPNAGVAFNSEHLYFVAPSAIMPGMTSKTSDLTSWSSFQGVNTRLSAYSKDGTFLGFTVYAPPGPGIQVLVSPSGSIAGFVTAEPAAWGFHPFYFPGRGRPTPSKVFGRAYWSVLLLQPVRPGSATGMPAGT
jgi:hypothetical protein